MSLVCFVQYTGPLCWPVLRFEFVLVHWSCVCWSDAVVTLESGSEAGFSGSDPGRKKNSIFSEGDYHIEISGFSFQKYAQRVPLGKYQFFETISKSFIKNEKS